MNGFRSLFANRGYRALWAAQFVSVLGDFIALFGVVSFITFRLHGTPSDVTSVILASTLSMALVTPFGGALVDRLRVKWVLVASDLIRAVLVSSLVLVHDVRHIAILLAANSVVSSFFAPAQMIALRKLVPPGELLTANALMAQAFFAVRSFSPALAGALVALLGERACFWADGASFAVSGALLATLPLVHVPHPHDITVRSLARDFRDANRFIFTHRQLTFAFVALSAAMLVFGGFMPLIAVYVRDHLHGGPLAYGFASTMLGVGLIIGTGMAARVAKGRHAPSVIIAGLFGFGVGPALLGAIPHPVGAALGTFTAGFAFGFVMVPGQTLSQTETPPAMMGRVSSTFMALYMSAQTVGLAFSGRLADALGIRTTFYLCAVTMAVFALAGRLWMRPRAAMVGPPAPG
jgi:MFS family permease